MKADRFQIVVELMLHFHHDDRVKLAEIARLMSTLRPEGAKYDVGVAMATSLNSYQDVKALRRLARGVARSVPPDYRRMVVGWVEAAVRGSRKLDQVIEASLGTAFTEIWD